MDWNQNSTYRDLLFPSITPENGHGYIKDESSSVSPPSTLIDENVLSSSPVQRIPRVPKELFLQPRKLSSPIELLAYPSASIPSRKMLSLDDLLQSPNERDQHENDGGEYESESETLNCNTTERLGKKRKTPSNSKHKYDERARRRRQQGLIILMYEDTPFWFRQICDEEIPKVCQSKINTNKAPARNSIAFYYLAWSTYQRYVHDFENPNVRCARELVGQVYITLEEFLQHEDVEQYWRQPTPRTTFESRLAQVRESTPIK